MLSDLIKIKDNPDSNFLSACINLNHLLSARFAYNKWDKYQLYST